MSSPLDDIAGSLAGLLRYHRRTRPLTPPKCLHLSPLAYRAWRDIGGGDFYQGVPIRCTERLAAGVYAAIPPPAAPTK